MLGMGPEKSGRWNHWSTELKVEAFKYIMARGYANYKIRRRVRPLQPWPCKLPVAKQESSGFF